MMMNEQWTKESLDEIERQVKAGHYMLAEDFFRWLRAKIIRIEDKEKWSLEHELDPE